MAKIQPLFLLTSLLFLFFVFDNSIVFAEAKIRHLRWVVAYQFKSPDCFQKLTVTINGQSPGPTIEAEEGDTVVVEVTNNLGSDKAAIDWHGIRQFGTPWSDGTEGVTQCPITPGDTFVYKFVVDRAGTYMYDAHYGMQRSAGLYGMIKVAVPNGVVEPFSYDYERSFIFSDWWHKSTDELATGLSSIPFVFVGEPQSLLINGKGRFNCSSMSGSSAVCNQTAPDCSPEFLTVVPGKTYRLRIGSMTSLSALNFEIEGHNLTVVEADGHYVKPFVVKNLFIYSGETYSVLLKADQPPTRNYWAALNIVSRKSNTTTATAIINYYPNHPLKTPPTIQPTGPLWNDTASRLRQSVAIRSHPAYIVSPPPASDREIILLNTQNKIDGHVRWSVNNVSFELPATPYLVAIKKKMYNVFDQSPAPDTYDYKNYDISAIQKNPNATSSSSIYRFEFNSTVDVILQNANTMNPNNSETHPWHLHGHDFWVLGYGMGKFDPKVSPKSYNLADPILKNTVAVQPYGWTALRFRADNPGVWAFHCHIEAHFFMGMGVVFESGLNKVGKLPKDIMGCGESKQLQRILWTRASLLHILYQILYYVFVFWLPLGWMM